MSQMLYVFCYDISDDRIRRRVAGLLEDKGIRVQESLFEMRVTHSAAKALARHLSTLLGPEDKLRIYCLDQKALERTIVVSGLAPLSSDAFILVE